MGGGGKRNAQSPAVTSCGTGAAEQIKEKSGRAKGGFHLCAAALAKSAQRSGSAWPTCAQLTLSGAAIFAGLLAKCHFDVQNSTNYAFLSGTEEGRGAKHNFYGNLSRHSPFCHHRGNLAKCPNKLNEMKMKFSRKKGGARRGLEKCCHVSKPPKSWLTETAKVLCY